MEYPQVTIPDAALWKLPAGGQPQLIDQFGAEGYDYLNAVLVHPSGDVWVAGETEGSLGAPIEGFRDAFVRVYPFNGGDPTTDQFGSLGEEECRAMSVDMAGNVWVVGTTNGDLAGSWVGRTDAFARKYPADGAPPVTYQFGTEEVDVATGVTSDNLGNIWIAGYVADDNGTAEAFLRKYPADASIPVTYGPSATWQQNVSGVVHDGWGNIWIVGSHEYAAPDAGFVFGGYAHRNPAGGQNATSRVLESDEFWVVDAIASDGAGNVWIAGTEGSKIAVRQLAQ